MQDPLLWLRVFASALSDVSVAAFCGLLIVQCWGGLSLAPRSPEVPGAVPALWPAAVTLFLSAVLNLVVVTAIMSAESTPVAIARALPDVASTYAGGVDVLLVAGSFALMICTLLPFRTSRKRVACSLLLLLIIVLKAGSGHASAHGSFSRDEVLQLFHLSAMSLWAGAILVSAWLFTVPRTARTLERSYLASLSLLSTWAVAAVLLSGVLKGFFATSGQLRQLRNAWGSLLIAKSACVLLAVLLGGLNRLHLMRNPAETWSPDSSTRSVRLLRVEACAMAVILILSAWLANSPPPGE